MKTDGFLAEVRFSPVVPNIYNVMAAGKIFVNCPSGLVRPDSNIYQFNTHNNSSCSHIVIGEIS